MAELSRLRFTMGTTVFLVGLIFFIFLVLIDLVITYLTAYSFSWWGFLIIVPIAVLFMVLQWALGPVLVKWSAKVDDEAFARGESNEFLRRTVSKLCMDSGVPVPRIAVIINPEPNAFVFGRTMRDTYLVVHDSLLTSLTKDEIECVLGHEIGHLRHKDHIVMTVVSSVPLLTYILARGGLMALRTSRGGGKGRGQAMLIIAIVAGISYLIYLLTQMLVLFLSRSREYYADSYSAYVTKNPAGLESALVKLMTGLSLSRDREAPSGLRSFYAVDPVKCEADNGRYRERMSEYDLNSDGVIDQKELEIAMEKERRNPWRSANELFSTHPNIYKRVLMLRRIELEMESDMAKNPGTERRQTPAEKDYVAGPAHMGGGLNDAEAAWRD